MISIKQISSGKTVFYVGVLIILVVALGFRFHRLAERERDTFFLDESLSVILSNYGTYGWTEAFTDDSRMFTGAEAKAIFFADDNSLKEVLSDVKSLWIDNRDEPHTNIYYSLLRISFLGADTGQMLEVMHRAFYLNLFLFVIGFFVLIRLIRRLFDNNILLWCILVCAFINPASVINTLLFRPYQFQELMFILLAYVVTHVYFLIKEKKEIKVKGNIPLLIGSALVLAFGFLAGYFGVAFVFLMWFSIMLFAIWNKQRTTFCYLGVVLLLSFVFVFMFYPNFLVGFFNYRSEEALDKFSIDYFLSKLYYGVIKPSFGQFNRYYFGVDKLLVIFAAAGIALYLHWRENKTLTKNVILFLIFTLCGGCWIFVVMYFSPWVGMRYFMSVLPVFCVGLIGILSCTRFKVFYVLIAFMTVYLPMRSTGIMDYYVEVKDEQPMIIGGEYKGLMQVPMIRYFWDERLVGFTFDRQNFEQKMDALSQKEVILYIDENIVFDYVDTLKYDVIDKSIGHPGGGFSTFYLLKKESDN